MKVRAITKSQEELAAFVGNFYLEHGIPPTLRQIANEYQVNVSAIPPRLRVLIKHGLLRERKSGENVATKFFPVVGEGCCPCCGKPKDD